MTHWKKDLWMVSLEDTNTSDISFNWNKCTEGKLTSSNSLASISQRRGTSFFSHPEKSSSLLLSCCPLFNSAWVFESTGTMDSRWDKGRIWIPWNTSIREKKWRPCLQTNTASSQQECKKGSQQQENKKRETALVWLDRQHIDFQNDGGKICCWGDKITNFSSWALLTYPGRVQRSPRSARLS